ncbi:MAG: dienelactone hydrolase family protein [Rhodospirillales bacterium]|nr:dienelactone hydrolase family protein [Rhodospirillales bacterium]
MYTKQSVDVQVDGRTSSMEILVFQPEGAGPFPGIMVAQHLPIAHEGLELDPFTIDVGDKLVAAGYACVIPYVFHWWPPETDVAVKREEFRDDWTVADLDAAYQVLCGLDKVDPDRTAIMGHCWGGRVSWLGACHNPNYKAMATLYGGRIKLAFGDGVPPIELADRIPCPVIGIFGNDDMNPSPKDVTELDAALTAAGVEHKFHQYDGAGHGFQDFVNKERWRPEQTADSWARVLAFFERLLK